jgi:hypothetical protein
MKHFITCLLAAHHIRKAKRWKAQRIHDNRTAYRLGFRKATRHG